MTEENKAVEEKPVENENLESSEKVEVEVEKQAEAVEMPAEVMQEAKAEAEDKLEGETPLPIVVAEKEEEPAVAEMATGTGQPAAAAATDDKPAFKTKWNWGAFSLSLFFAVGNKSYLGLLVLLGFVPFLGQIFALVWAIIYGLNAEKWTLESLDNHYRDEEEFRKVMDSWNTAGLIAFIILAALLVLSLIFFFAIFASVLHNLQDLNNSNYYGG